ncbi:MAG: peptidase [Moraxellaceae bacterium]|nr:peptidase [Moraxellaceae bacterium]
MTYCVAMKLAEGLVMASDSRTNAGVDHIATFRKMAVFEKPGEAVIVVLSAGNLATTQSTLSTLRQRLQDDTLPNLYNQRSLYDVAVLVGAALREIIHRDGASHRRHDDIDYGCSFLVGGQLRGEEPRLFHVYPQGNFIEASVDTPFFQIGEAKYGKPILDRVIQFDTTLKEAAKCVLISFDSSIRSNVSVGLPIDLVCYRRDSLVVGQQHRVGENDEYFQMIRREWSQGLRQIFSRIPDPPYWAAEPECVETPARPANAAKKARPAAQKPVRK